MSDDFRKAHPRPRKPPSDTGDDDKLAILWHDLRKKERAATQGGDDMADSRPEIRVKGITANTVVTVLMALGAGGGGLAAYRNWPDSGPIVAAVDEAARSAAATLTADFAQNRTKTWEAINGLKETQSKTAANLDVLTNNVNNLTETLKQATAADLARDQRQDVQDDRQDDRLLDLERRTP